MEGTRTHGHTLPCHASCPFQTKNFGSFKIIVTKHFQRHGVAKQRSRRPSQGCLHTLHNGTRLKEWDKLKKGCSKQKWSRRDLRFPSELGCLLKGQWAHRAVLTLSLEKFHERFKLCVDENHHFQGAELRSWSWNPIERRSCRKVTARLNLDTKSFSTFLSSAFFSFFLKSL